ncbi:unnamed protein product [Toxocara canis]|uniref:CRAL-TRIO domain-containing protein n=1 Tax=Toxocara canis TaxID=6265 RepID=A0A183VG09_TOXCA|nr:unnamed protein product [Toxocara canis]
MSMNDTCYEAISTGEETAMRVIRETLGELLEQFPSFGSHFTIKRWLEEYDCSVETIIDKLTWVLNTLNAFGASKMDTSSLEAANEAVSTATNTAQYFPGGFMGYDKEGNVLFMQPFGRLHSEESMRTTRISDFYRLLLLEGYASQELISAQEKKHGCRKGQISILDFDGFSRHVLYVPGLPTLSTAYGLLQLAYPGLSKKIYIINAPSALAYAVGVVQMVLSKVNTHLFRSQFNCSVSCFINYRACIVRNSKKMANIFSRKVIAKSEVIG